MKKVATTVKVEESLYDSFKVLGIHCKATLQSVVEKCIYRYVKDEAFRRDMNAFVPDLTITGSAVPQV